MSAAPTWLFGQTVHEGCDRGGYYEQAEFARGVRLAAMHRETRMLGAGGAMQCRQARLDGRIGGCPNVGGICIGCTMPGFPDKFMPFMNQPPGRCSRPRRWRPMAGPFTPCAGSPRRR